MLNEQQIPPMGEHTDDLINLTFDVLEGEELEKFIERNDTDETFEDLIKTLSVIKDYRVINRLKKVVERLIKVGKDNEILKEDAFRFALIIIYHLKLNGNFTNISVDEVNVVNDFYYSIGFIFSQVIPLLKVVTDEEDKTNVELQSSASKLITYLIPFLDNLEQEQKETVQTIIEYQFITLTSETNTLFLGEHGFRIIDNYLQIVPEERQVLKVVRTNSPNSIIQFPLSSSFLLKILQMGKDRIFSLSNPQQILFKKYCSIYLRRAFLHRDLFKIEELISSISKARKGNINIGYLLKDLFEDLLEEIKKLKKEIPFDKQYYSGMVNLVTELYLTGCIQNSNYALTTIIAEILQNYIEVNYEERTLNQEDLSDNRILDNLFQISLIYLNKLNVNNANMFHKVCRIVFKFFPWISLKYIAYRIDIKPLSLLLQNLFLDEPNEVSEDGNIKNKRMDNFVKELELLLKLPNELSKDVNTSIYNIKSTGVRQSYLASIVEVAIQRKNLDCLFYLLNRILDYTISNFPNPFSGIIKLEDLVLKISEIAEENVIKDNDIKAIVELETIVTRLNQYSIDKFPNQQLQLEKIHFLLLLRRNNIVTVLNYVNTRFNQLSKPKIPVYMYLLLMYMIKLIIDAVINQKPTDKSSYHLIISTCIDILGRKDLSKASLYNYDPLSSFVIFRAFLSNLLTLSQSIPNGEENSLVMANISIIMRLTTQSMPIDLDIRSN